MMKKSNPKTDPGNMISGDSAPEFLVNNRFRIKKKLGKGGMGEIFLAEDTKLKRNVAIKRISKENLEDKDSKTRFLREAQTASQIEHPNICPIYEIYEEENNNYIIMQYIDGVSLDSIIRYQELDLKKILGISIQICEGMIEAHSVGIIHRDLKPGNVMVDKKGNVKLLDFGLAKFRDESDTRKHGISNSNLTEKGIVIGTVSYMSPEQARGEPLDFRNDIFSFGIILFEMIEGFNPFFDAEQITTLYNVLNKEPVFKSNIEKKLKNVVLKCLKKKRTERYESFKKLKEELEKIKEAVSPKIEKKYQTGMTEIIELQEKEEILKKIEQSSSAEDLGDLVYRIKKIKTETVPVVSTKRWFRKRPVFITLILFFAAAVIFFSGFFNAKRNGKLHQGINYILLKTFDGDVSSIMKDEALYLISVALNSKKNIKVIGEDTLASLKNTRREANNGTNLLKKFNIYYSLKGKISKFSNIYNFDITLESLPSGEKSSITVPGLDTENSLLSFQINSLANRVLKKITGNEPKIKLQKIFGNNWAQFQLFFRGLKEFKKLNISEAKQLFQKTGSIPLSNYYLANLYFFNGDRIKSKNLLSKLNSKSVYLPEMMKLKALALQARLEMDFSKEIKFLLSLKNLDPLAKESSYELGEAFFHRGDAVNALKYYRSALDIDRNYSKALNHTGYCYSYLGNHEMSIESFESYRDLDKSANSFDSLGDGYFYSGDLLSAEASKQTALKIDEKGVYWGYLTLADIYLLKERFSDAMIAADKYIKISEEKYEKADGIAKKAFIRYARGEYKIALQLINKALSIYDSSDINNESAEEHWIRGLLLLKSGKVDEAKNDLNWLKKIVKDNSLSAQNFKQPLKYYYHLNAEINDHEGNDEIAQKNFDNLLDLKYRLSYWITQYNQQYFKTEYTGYLIKKKRISDAVKSIDECLALGDKYLPALKLKVKLLDLIGDVNNAEKYRQDIASLFDSKREKL